MEGAGRGHRGVEMRVDVTCACDVVRGTLCTRHLTEDMIDFLERQARAEAYLSTRYIWRKDLGEMHARISREHARSAELIRQRYTSA